MEKKAMISDNKRYKDIKIIGFDADDTLWVNELYYKEAEKEFYALMADYLPVKEATDALFETEIQNLEWYGYGAKGFLLSQIETAIRISGGNVPVSTIEKIIRSGKNLLDRQIELLDGVEWLLPQLQKRYHLIIATKGDLLDQERKLKKSGLLPFFHHIEIMSDKQEADYKKLITNLGIRSEEFLMVGNSLKSDIFPVLAIGGKAVYVPYHLNWQYETTEESTGFDYQTIGQISDLVHLLP
jgi:putative hydrolase of the HAD superfamily